MKKLLLFTIIFLCKNLFGYVENTTKGYANCLACHISPNGGGILNDYGRSLSSELMSTWKVASGFEKPFYGAFQNSRNIKYGGQLRTIQVYSENDQIKVKRKFIMQNNLELAIKNEQVLAIGTIGKREGPKESVDRGEFLSERHYLLWETSSSSRLRIGKFRQHFGINHPNHTRFVKTSLGFGSNSESYNFEFSKFFEWGEVNLSSSLGSYFSEQEDDTSLRNFVLNFTHYLNGNYRMGSSFLTERTSSYKRHIFGVNAVFPLGRNIIARSEVDLEQKKTVNGTDYNNKADALYGDHQIGYNIYKGIISYIIFEHSQADLSESQTQVYSPGAGVQFLPIPHVELQAEYQRRSYKQSPGNPEHRAFITFHLYH